MAHILEFELPDPEVYLSLSDGALDYEIDKLEFWLTVLDFQFVRPAADLLVMKAAGQEVRISKKREWYLLDGLYRLRQVKVNLRVANDEQHRRIIEIARKLSTA